MTRPGSASAPGAAPPESTTDARRSARSSPAPRHPQGLFIAGTDTGIGKTCAAVSIVRALAAQGLRVAVMKPVAAGAASTPRGLRNDDAAALAAAANVAAPYDLVNPYCLVAPVSPHIAAAEEGVAIDIARIRQCFRELAVRADCVIVEGAGGWLAPLSERETLADVARALALPVVLVVGLRLGCLSHALLTARAIESSGLPLAGWIANHVDPGFERLAENLATLERSLAQPPLAFIPHRAALPSRELGAGPSAAAVGPGVGLGLGPALEPGMALPQSACEALRSLCGGG